MAKFDHAIYYLFLAILTGCAASQEDYEGVGERQHKGELIYRNKQESVFEIPPLQARVREKYPWEESFADKYPRITKEFFRCNGSSLNPPLIIKESGKETQCFFDCGGLQKHSLPMRNKKEFIYPILIDLLNYVQAKTGEKVVITSGYRCPQHNAYLDHSSYNRTSKHLIGAEVDFYVQGYEGRPEKIISLLQQYYQETSHYTGQKEYLTFERYEKPDTNVSITPWYNKEIFIKLFKKNEGRNVDNRHPYPYISLQVRYDRELKERVVYSPEKATKCYLRW